MKARIHWEIDDRHDYVDITGNEEHIKIEAELIIKKRNPDNYWSEILEE